jgi:cytochrome b561
MRHLRRGFEEWVSMVLASRYTRTAMVLHWAIAILMVANVLIIWTVDSLPQGWQRPVINTHKSFGITVLGLGLLRLLWRFANPPPALPAAYPKWERWAAHIAHIALYALILSLPLSGWIHDSAWKDGATHPMSLYGTIPFPRISYFVDLPADTKEAMHKLFGNIHSLLGYGLYGLFVLHVAGALKHQFIDKEPELQRMLPWGRTPDRL